MKRKNKPTLDIDRFLNDGDIVWYLNGKRHREDGPAIESSSGTKYWCLNGKELTEEQFEKQRSRESKEVKEKEDVSD